MSKTQTLITTLKATIAIAALVVAAGGGFKAGGYWEAGQYEKAALAHSCGVLDAKTLAFSWNDPMEIRMGMDSFVEQPQPKPAKKGGAK